MEISASSNTSDPESFLFFFFLDRERSVSSTVVSAGSSDVTSAGVVVELSRSFCSSVDRFFFFFFFFGVFSGSSLEKNNDISDHCSVSANLFN